MMGRHLACGDGSGSSSMGRFESVDGGADGRTRGLAGNLEAMSWKCDPHGRDCATAHGAGEDSPEAPGEVVGPTSSALPRAPEGFGGARCL